ncbi:Asp/Glu/Hydantoin racemase [Desulfosporosinus orientis DSM 765]|uniref:Asp/Glu/Hydantoin racemase n=1 Tax=Desulfosporosinus orientis (strain ATCC 19365 / DSM 765 / NCIMB 8382 / VKM B-1628 / Singapore I) TaxID=768706 RepID=G7W6Y2_DESOD|nr:aspartate/glutamate racemase family protein [Desulfosporosinus orientis]AET69839.1 Asp/Glu/Hydantoin racemase [Desulfosporosinus orientis DSM 765]
MCYGYEFSSRQSKKSVFSAPVGQYISGYTIGVLVLDLWSPKIPGMVASAASYRYPVRHKLVEVHPPERLLYGDPEILEELVIAGKELEKEGVRAIVGACGYFGHFQPQLASALNVPVYLTSLLQIPMIKAGLKSDQKVGILCADSDNMTIELLKKTGVDDPNIYVIRGMGIKPEFSAIMENRTSFNNEELKKEIINEAVKLVAENPEVGALLLECSDFPPYSFDIQQEVRVPVFDYMTLINWAHQAVAQRPYQGDL